MDISEIESCDKSSYSAFGGDSTMMSSFASKHPEEYASHNQEIHSMKMKLTQAEHMNEIQKNEIEALEKQVEQHTHQLNDLKSRHKAELTKLTVTITTLDSEIEKKELEMQQLAKQVADRDRQIADYQTEVRELSKPGNNDSCELSAVQDELHVTRLKLRDVQSEMSKLRNQLEMEELNVRRQHDDIESLQHELEQERCQNTTLSNQIESKMAENRELHDYVEVLKHQSQNRNKKGNSLFSEVEDRRIEAEEELVDIKRQYAKVKGECTSLKDHNHSMRRFLAQQAHTTERHVDATYVESLKTQLQQAKGEALQHAEKVVKLSEELKNAHELTRTPQAVDVEARVLLLQKQQMTTEIDTLRKDLASTELQFMLEGRKLIEEQQRHLSTRRDLAKEHEAKVQCQLLVDELRMKYEPENIKPPSAKKRVLVKQPSKAPSDEDKEVNEPQPTMVKSEHCAAHEPANHDNDVTTETNKAADIDMGNCKPHCETKRIPAKRVRRGEKECKQQ